MDCISVIEIEFARLDGRPVSAAFHLVQIRRALHFIQDWLKENAEPDEIREACADALEAVAALNAPRAAFEAPAPKAAHLATDLHCAGSSNPAV